MTTDPVRPTPVEPEAGSPAGGERTGRRLAAFVAGLGMALFSLLTIRHFFAANYPDSVFAGSACDMGAFLNCSGTADSFLATVAGVPLGVPGLVLGTLFALGAVFPSPGLIRTNRFLAACNGVAVLALIAVSLFVLRTLCLLCAGYFAFSFLAAWALAAPDEDGGGSRGRWLRPSLRHLVAIGCIGLAVAWGFREYHEVRRSAGSGGAAERFVREFFELPQVPWPSEISPYRSHSATRGFENAPIRIVEYADPLCSDCRYLHEQLKRLEPEFGGLMNVAFQFFPLEAECNDVVEKDKHPGACELSFMLAHEPELFPALLDRVFADMEAAKDPAWRMQLAREFGVEGARNDSVTIRTVRQFIETGREYERTSEEYAHGIRSTPTLIVNNRLVIGTFPDSHMRALLRALVEEATPGGRQFLEGWVE
ncbi:MAG: vitamin K epoxide reductase family protein [Gemmatimonadota bacterium]|nr:vitamin K epoxide reductase family protein [Gemmatimonadota bacterium]